MQTIDLVLMHHYKAMVRACYTVNARAYRNVGGRGIGMCREWKKSFAAFALDMGEPGPYTTLVRKDENGPFNKDNCVWR